MIKITRLFSPPQQLNTKAITESQIKDVVILCYFFVSALFTGTMYLANVAPYFLTSHISLFQKKPTEPVP